MTCKFSHFCKYSFPTKQILLDVTRISLVLEVYGYSLKISVYFFREFYLVFLDLAVSVFECNSCRETHTLVPVCVRGRTCTYAGSAVHTPLTVNSIHNTPPCTGPTALFVQVSYLLPCYALLSGHRRRRPYAFLLMYDPSVYTYWNNLISESTLFLNCPVKPSSVNGLVCVSLSQAFSVSCPRLLQYYNFHTNSSSEHGPFYEDHFTALASLGVKQHLTNELFSLVLI